MLNESPEGLEQRGNLGIRQVRGFGVEFFLLIIIPGFLFLRDLEEATESTVVPGAVECSDT